MGSRDRTADVNDEWDLRCGFILNNRLVPQVIIGHLGPVTCRRSIILFFSYILKKGFSFSFSWKNWNSMCPSVFQSWMDDDLSMRGK